MASATRLAFFHAPTYASDDKKSYDIGPVLVKELDYDLAIMNQLTSPHVCESLLEVELLRINLKNKKSFQSQMTANAIKVMIANYMPANDLTEEEHGNLWDLVNPQYGDSYLSTDFRAARAMTSSSAQVFSTVYLSMCQMPSLITMPTCP